MNKTRKVMCPRCGYVWEYTGRHARRGRGIISCSYCKTTMSLSQAIGRAKGHPVSRDDSYKIPLRLKIQQQIKANKKKIKKMEVEKNDEM